MLSKVFPDFGMPVCPLRFNDCEFFVSAFWNSLRYALTPPARRQPHNRERWNANPTVILKFWGRFLEAVGSKWLHFECILGVWEHPSTALAASWGRGWLGEISVAPF